MNRPIEEVFAFFAEPANNPKWEEGLIECRKTSPGPMGVGAQVLEVRKFMGRHMESTLEVTAFEPNKKYAVKVASGPIPFELSAMFEPGGVGTKIAVTGRGEPGGFFKLAEGLVKKQLQSQVEGDMGRLKKVLEG
jgi:hypothetical protein